MSSTTEPKISPTEVKLLLTVISSTKLPSIPWPTVVSGLDCNIKAAQERWRRFKIKLQGEGNKPVTATEVKLLLAIIPAVQLTGVDWGVVSKELGINNKAAQERWRRFKLKLLGNGEVEGQSDGHAADVVKKSGKGKASAKTTNGGGGKKSGAAAKKRKIEDESEEETSTDGGPVGGVNRSAKKRARIVEEKAEEEIGEDYEGEGPERESDEFFEAEDGLSVEGGYEGEGEGPEYEV
jgi:hypothetical protein